MKKILFYFSFFLFISASATTHVVNSGNFYYSPSTLTISVGDTVRWVNDGGTHNVNFDINTLTGTSYNNPESFVSTATSAMLIYEHVFNIPGVYGYDCSVGSHADNGMTGTITVLGSVYDIIANSADHGTLKAAIDACGLDGVLSQTGTFTVFAPTDVAFDALPAGTVTDLLNDIPELTEYLLHHVLGAEVLSTVLTDGMTAETLLGTELTVTLPMGMVYIDNAMVTGPDIAANNGVVHVIDAVLLPETDCNGYVNGTSLVDTCGSCQQAYVYDFVSHTVVNMLNDTSNVSLGMTETIIMPNDPMNPYWNSCLGSVYGVIATSVDHTILKAAVLACGLEGVLSQPGPYTVFAPTDSAFNQLPPGTIDDLLNDIPTLTEILQHHVLADSVVSTVLTDGMTAETLLGTELTVTLPMGMVHIDDAMVIVPDITANNGVVHVIDGVLLPPVSLSELGLDNEDKKLYTIDMLGRIISNPNGIKNQILIDVYESGKVVKWMSVK